jgi:hypothetical protein
MGGSGGGSGFTATSSSVRERSREAHDTADQAAFESDINGFLEEKLKGYNSRDANLVRARLDEILGAPSASLVVQLAILPKFISDWAV